ncbi:preprotein translocase subunit TatB [Thermodesulfomicrobium sp. WS]|uniref:sulfurtransferase TusA family protein n=1 Tax=Thermodesulfomicrobium sp. WS TaxID=3004129 RepID=UPI00249182F4|nr:sulfurtransferase TusA family protein [Thermodesulfomicrobium sp. WS]BDV01831.1 preprotein translocase subunit TatB [Thermodesulfomicrobium sp. WS]
MKVDARGLSCPQPVLLALQAISEAGSGAIEVLVDTEASCENVTRAAEGRGWSVAVTELPGGEFRLELRK